MKILFALLITGVSVWGASSTCTAGSTCPLSADVVLSGTDVVNWQSGATINASNFRVYTSGAWTGSITITGATVNDLGSTTTHMFDISGSSSGGTISITGTIFHRSADFQVSGTHNFTFSGNTIATDAIYGSTGQIGNNATQRFFYESNGAAGTYTKQFSNNNILHGGKLWFTSTNWIVSNNIMIGPRANITAVGSGTLVSYNYTHVLLSVTPDQPWWGDVQNYTIGSGVIAENNVINGGQWVFQGAGGEIRNNVIVEWNDHAMIVSSPSVPLGKIHNNIWAHARGGANGYGNTVPAPGETWFQVGYSTDTLNFYNNTIDARNKTSLVLAVANGTSYTSVFKNNAVYGLDTSVANSDSRPVIGPYRSETLPANPFNRISYGDYNLFHWAKGTKNNYGIGVTGATVCVTTGFGAHDQVGGVCPNGSVDPMYQGVDGAGMLPNRFPFSDDEIVAGTVTVQNVLNFYQYVYSPRNGSPLLGHADDGSNIGAVNSQPTLTLTNHAPVPGFSAYEITHWVPSMATVVPWVGAVLSLDGWYSDDGLGGGTPTLTWSKVSGPGNVSFSNVNAGYTTATFGAQGSYVIRLTANDGTLTGTADATILVNNNPPPLPTPTLSAVPFSATQANLSWSIVSNPNVTGYNVYRNGTQIAQTASQSFSDTGLTPSTTYSYTVASHDAAGNLSALSTALSVTTPALPPSAPIISSFTALPFTMNPGQSATLSWIVTGNPLPTVSIDQGIGTVSATGSTVVAPNATTTYTLTATNSNGSATSAITVTIVPPGQGGNHPRIWLTDSFLTFLRAKVSVNDPDWVNLKAQADSFLNMAAPKFTVVSATNSNPVQITLAQPVPWSTTTTMYIGGGTGGWAGINQLGSKPSPVTATKTGTDTFTVPIDATGFGPFTGQNLVLFFNNGGFNGYIQYPYEGAGWQTALETLALAYKVTGSTIYGSKALELLNYIATLGAAGMVAPESIDSGFPSRTLMVGIGLAYDWLYELIPPAQKPAIISAINLWYDWYQAYAFDKEGPAYDNYFGGHLLGFGLSAFATDGDNSRSAEITSAVRTLFNTYIPSSFTQGGFAGGYPVESYNYGPNHFIRLLEYMLAVKTVTGEDLFSSANYAQTIAGSLIYNLKPNRWQTTDEGDFSGDYTGILNPNLPIVLSSVINGTKEGAWMQFLYQNLAPAPGATQPQTPDPLTRFLFYDSTRTATDYRQTVPTYTRSLGDEHVYHRTDWSDNAVYSSFEAGASHWGGHEMRAAGHLSIQRGNDYLLVNSGQWKGLSGYQGSPEAFDLTSWRANTLFLNDFGAYNFNGSDYVGGQGYWGTNAVLAYDGSSDAVYSKGDQTPAYLIPSGYANPANRSLRFFYRSYLSFSDGTVVLFDRAEVAKSNFIKTLYFHFNPTGGPPAISGNTVVSRVGSSALFMKTLLPNAPVLNPASDPVNAGNPNPITYRVEVSDSVGGTGLTALHVFIATDISAASMPLTSRIDASNMVGAFTTTNMPRIAMFSLDGTPQNGVTYTASYAANVSGLHVLADMVPGTYDVYRDGAKIVAGVLASAQGLLKFTASGGTAFQVVRTGVAPSPCDINGDGAVDNKDMIAEISFALTRGAPRSADLDGDGIVTVIDVQRVINASLGAPCRLGP